MGASSKKQTIGYKYYVGMHLALVHGPVDEISEIRVGERVAWSGSVTAGQSIQIDAPELFGGEKREGGVSGTVDVLMGTPDQPQNSYLQSTLGAVIPAFRGVMSLVLNQCYLGNNPYLKPWAIKAKRIPKAWYVAKAEISGDANPAHIVREVLTNTTWGMGYGVGDLDDTSFTAAADTLYSEGLGLSLLWSDPTPIERFVLDILKHIDGSLYVDPQSGLFTLTLARGGYDPATLLLLDPSNVREVIDFSRPAWGEITNQVTVVYHDRETDTERPVTLQDMAAIQMQGAVVATTLQYPGISTPANANAACMRDLKQLATPLARATVTANRQAAGLKIGDVFKLSWPAYGITEMVMRVVNISYGLLTSGEVRLQCVQDVFALADSVYAAPSPTGWVDPTQPPAAAPYRRLTEMPYWTVIRDITGENPSLLNDMDPDFGLLSVQAARPSGDALNYEVWSRVGTADFSEAATGDFTPHAELPDEIGTTETTFSLVGVVDLDLVAIDTLAYLGTEAVAVRAIDLAAGTVTVDRGVLDTVPAAHLAGTRLWFADLQTLIETEYVSGETVDARVLPATGQGQLALSNAPTDTLTFNKRFQRPYPPGNLRINGVYRPYSISGQATVEWSHRDRIQQTAYLVTQTEGDIGPEAGTTYTLRIFGETGTLIRTYADLTTTSQLYPEADELADSSLERLNYELTLELEAAREGLLSWQPQRHTVKRPRPVDSDHTLSIRWSGGAIFDFALPVSWSLAVGSIHSLPVAYDAYLSVNADFALPVGWGAVIAADHALPVEWEGAEPMAGGTDLNFTEAYTPPSGNAVDLNFT